MASEELQAAVRPVSDWAVGESREGQWKYVALGLALGGISAAFLYRWWRQREQSSVEPNDPEQFQRWLSSKRHHAKRWVWLESNPEVMNQYLNKLGVRNHRLVDIYGTDPELLDMVEGPVRSVLLLFPHKPSSQTLSPTQHPSVWHTYQYVRGACGSVGLLHAVMNNLDNIELDDNSFYGKFAADSRHLTPAARAALFYQNEEVEAIHQQTARADGTSQDTSYSTNQNLHFNAFVHRAGGLYELDGLKAGPVFHGPTTPATLLQDAVRVIETQFMAKDPSNINFTMMALVPSNASEEALVGVGLGVDENDSILDTTRSVLADFLPEN
eukprot:gb/GEZN01010223.1/.p1 GENE.gb/GEZN01010223.1/~~gb/GEZN01010223.1/.p1  ORF type:complete len:327 (-),score=47.24 gb/GEZN01010223.1/:238-1218(-)